MSKVEKQMIACPKCGKETEVSYMQKIEMPYDEEQKEKIMKNGFFCSQCTSCKVVFPVLYDCEYNDLEKKYMIWFIPHLTDDEKVRVMQYNQKLKTDKTLQLAQGGYRYRLVGSVYELVEKIIIFDHDLDDRFVETMKLAYLPMIQKNLDGESKIMGMFLNVNQQNKYTWVVFLDNKEPLVLECDIKIYQDMKEKLASYADEKMMEGFAWIETKWANAVMEAYQNAQKANDGE